MGKRTPSARCSQDTRPQNSPLPPEQRILRRLRQSIAACEALLRRHDSRGCDCRLCGAVFGLLWAMEAGESQIEALLDRAAADREQAECVQPDQIIASVANRHPDNGE